MGIFDAGIVLPGIVLLEHCAWDCTAAEDCACAMSSTHSATRIYIHGGVSESFLTRGAVLGDELKHFCFCSGEGSTCCELVVNKCMLDSPAIADVTIALHLRC